MSEQPADLAKELYLRRLEKELHILGLARPEIDKIVLETRDHLTEAMDEARPKTEQEALQIIQRFGSARSLAKSIIAEHERPSSRTNLWPATYALIAFIFFRTVLRYITLDHPRFWLGTWFLLASAAVLLLLGYRGRRPAVGQFALLAASLIIVQTAWYATTSYPVKYSSIRGQEWYQPVLRRAANAEVLKLDRQAGREREVGRRMVEGKQVFSAANANRSVPQVFMNEGQYVLPEGVQEMTLGVSPGAMNRLLFTKSWDEAVNEWKEKQPGHADSSADEIIKLTPGSIAHWEGARDYLLWIRNQPLPVQVANDFRMTFMPTAALCGMAMFTANAGWLLWLVIRGASRLVRRVRYQDLCSLA